MAEDRSLALRPTGIAAAFQQARTPVHERAVPAWTDAPLTREDCLERLPVKVREVAMERIGSRIEWWATDLGGGITLVALGSKALVVVSPAAGRDGKAAFKVETIHLDEKSRRKARIQEAAQAAGSAARPSLPASGPTARPAAGPAVPADLGRRLQDMHRFLGMLPSRAQELMQEPFLRGTGDLDTDYLIFRHGPADAPGGSTVDLWGYITDRRVLTFCAGVGLGYRDGTGVASWDLNCWRVDTAPKAAASQRAVAR